MSDRAFRYIEKRSSSHYTNESKPEQCLVLFSDSLSGLLFMRVVDTASLPPHSLLRTPSHDHQVLRNFRHFVPEPYVTYPIKPNLPSPTRSQDTHSAVLWGSLPSVRQPRTLILSVFPKTRPPRKCMPSCFWVWPRPKATARPKS